MFRDNNTKSYLACPLATSHHSNLVVYTDQLANGGGVPGSSFSVSIFFIYVDPWHALIVRRLVPSHQPQQARAVYSQVASPSPLASRPSDVTLALSSLQACQFQIVAEEKSRWCATLGKAMSKL